MDLATSPDITRRAPPRTAAAHAGRRGQPRSRINQRQPNLDQDEIEATSHGFMFLRQLGRGNYGCVHLAKDMRLQDSNWKGGSGGGSGGGGSGGSSGGGGGGY